MITTLVLHIRPNEVISFENKGNFKATLEGENLSVTSNKDLSISKHLESLNFGVHVT